MQPLTSARLILEPLGPQHADELHPVLDDPELHRFIGGRPDTLAELRARLMRQAAGGSPDGREIWLNWLIRLRAGRDVAGTVQATVSVDAQPSVAYVAWVIGSAQQGHGYAREAAGLLVSHLQNRHCVVRARIHPGHHASMAVARSAGLSPTDVVESGEVRWEASA